jgi:hypothetical protein
MHVVTTGTTKKLGDWKLLVAVSIYSRFAVAAQVSY